MIKQHAAFLIGGAACLPVTFNITRNGTLLLSAMIIILIASAAFYIVRRFRQPEPFRASALFIVGAICSALSFYFRRQDTPIGHESALGAWFLETGAISAIGIATILVASCVTRKYLPRD